MALAKNAAWLLATVLLVACADGEADVTANHVAPAESNTGQLPTLSKDMAYADLRRQVVTDGWQPLPDPQCKANVGGDAAICDQIPELESCSGDGYCVMHFARNAEKLIVYAYGMTEDWRVEGEQSRLRVTEWELGR